MLVSVQEMPTSAFRAIGMRIALLEQKYPSDNDYIEMLTRQLQMYLDNPVLDRETESQMISRFVREAKERNG